MQFKMSAEQHRKLFGDPDPFDAPGPGKKRLCRVCGGWHRVDSWPHNCREPENRARNRELSTPMVIHDIEPHVENGTVIGSRNEQRQYMRENDLYELEDFTETSGAHKHMEDFDSRSYKEDLVNDIKRAMEEDPLNRPPPEMVEQANDEVWYDEEKIDTDSIEVVSDGRDGT